MTEHIGSGGQNRFHGLRISAKIGDKNFCCHSVKPAQGPNHPGEMSRPAVQQIIPCDACDHDMFEFHLPNRCSDTHRLILFRGRRDALSHRAEKAVARADIAEDHEGCRAVIPAAVAVWAHRIFADRVQRLLLKQTMNADIIAIGPQRGPHPAGKPFC